MIDFISLNNKIFNIFLPYQTVFSNYRNKFGYLLKNNIKKLNDDKPVQFDLEVDYKDSAELIYQSCQYTEKMNVK